MNDIGQKIKDARIKAKLSPKELSDKTKVRLYVIEAIEKGDYSIMPEVYINSFIKMICNYLKIQYDESLPTEKKDKQKKKKFDDEKIETTPTVVKKIEIIEKTKSDILSQFKKSDKESNFTSIFKKKNFVVENKYLIINSLVYVVLIAAIIGAIYFTLTSLNKSSGRIDNSEIVAGTDTISLEQETNNLFSFFEKPDSLKLTAKAHDTVWIRVLADGKSISESLLRPGMEESWKAFEYFIVDLGNVGGAHLFRNDEKLPLFGKAGSVVKNVKITATEVLNIYAPRSDSARAARKKAEEEQKSEPKMIEQSTIQTTPQFTVPKRDTLRF